MHANNTDTTAPASSYRVLVTDQITNELAAGTSRRYHSPPQSEQQARGLIAVPPQTEHRDHGGPWRQAIAGGQRIIELRGDP
jgi:hypothetical protein